MFAGARVLDVRALGDDQPDPACGTASVVLGYVKSGDAAGGALTGHRGHDDPVRQVQGADVERTKERGGQEVRRSERGGGDVEVL